MGSLPPPYNVCGLSQLPSTNSVTDESILTTTSSALASQPASTSTNSSQTNIRLLTETLQTPFSSVYQLIQDGTSYVMPSTLRSVPVTKITEDSPYWNASWESLDAFLAKQAEENALKEQYRARLRLEPENKAVQKKGKFHQDNMSKYHKIREIFGPDSNYHPNQLVSKQHLPLDGLCHKEIMYRLACKISDLRILHERGFLAMDPWDFIRWRISRKLQERQTFPGKTVNDCIRTIVYKLCDECGPENPYGDAIMREAVIFAAKFSGRLASYKSRKPASGHKQRPQQNRGRSGRPETKRPGRPRLSSSSARDPAEYQAAQEARRERRARVRAAQPSTYQGVNAFRAQMQARVPAATSGAP